MAKRKSKKLNTVALAAVAATLVFLALAVTGMLIDWVSVPNIGHGLGEALGQDAPERIGFTLAECATEWEVEEYNAMNALAIVTVVAAALTFVGAAATMITRNKLVKFAAMALGASKQEEKDLMGLSGVRLYTSCCGHEEYRPFLIRTETPEHRDLLDHLKHKEPWTCPW